MPTLEPKFNYGKRLPDEDPRLVRQLDIAYENTANILNTKTSVYLTNVAPQANAAINKNFNDGDFWVDRSVAPDKVYMLTDRTSATVVTWTALN